MRHRSSTRPCRPARRGRAHWRGWFPGLLALGLLLLAPALVRAQGAAQDSVTLRWTAVGDDSLSGTAAAYELRMSDSPITASSWSTATALSGLPVPLASGIPQQVTVRGLAQGDTVYFALRVRDDAGNWSGVSNLVRWDGVLDEAPPAAPAGLITELEGDGVHLSWTPSSAPDWAGYSVYRATAAGGQYTKLNQELLTVAEYQDDALPVDATSLWYQVTATDMSGKESARSASIPSVPAVPGGLASELQGNGVHLTWTPDGAPDVSGYSIYRATAAGGPYTKLNLDSLITAAEYQDDALPAGVDSLWYQATTTNVGGTESARSGSVSIATVPSVGRSPATVAWGIEAAYPNPSRVSDPDPVSIPVELVDAATARVDIVDAAGRLVRRLDDELQGLDVGDVSGHTEVEWDGKNDAGRAVAPGPYRAWLIAGDVRRSTLLVRVP